MMCFEIGWLTGCYFAQLDKLVLSVLSSQLLPLLLWLHSMHATSLGEFCGESGK